MCAKSPRIPWLSVQGRTMVSQCSCPEIVYSPLMGNIFPNSRCLSQSVPDPHHDCKWKGQLVQVRRHLPGPLRFLLDGGAFCGRMNKRNIDIITMYIRIRKHIHHPGRDVEYFIYKENLLSEANVTESYIICEDWQPLININVLGLQHTQYINMVSAISSRCVIRQTVASKALSVFGRREHQWGKHSIRLWNIYVAQW